MVTPSGKLTIKNGQVIVTDNIINHGNLSFSKCVIKSDSVTNCGKDQNIRWRSLREQIINADKNKLRKVNEEKQENTHSIVDLAETKSSGSVLRSSDEEKQAYNNLMNNNQAKGLLLRQSAASNEGSDEEFKNMVIIAKKENFINSLGNTSNRTALHFALLNKQYGKAIILLVDGSADFTISDKSNQTAVDIGKQDKELPLELRNLLNIPILNVTNQNLIFPKQVTSTTLGR